MLKEVIKATIISVLCLCVIFGIMACAFKDNFTPVEKGSAEMLLNDPYGPCNSPESISSLFSAQYIKQ